MVCYSSVNYCLRNCKVLFLMLLQRILHPYPSLCPILCEGLAITGVNNFSLTIVFSIFLNILNS
uniref:Putative ovule protein n=1 Tax=Solanum chacoense TaxID=4108 RepID=A0A0V0HVN3_SOLCH